MPRAAAPLEAPLPADAGGAWSGGTLLGGRVAYAQPLEGHRSGLEPVLLAAMVPARPGEAVVEGGTGAGAGLLCLAARVPELRGVGVEMDAVMAGFACRNLRANSLARIEVIVADVTDPETLAAGSFAHAFANPPWNRGTASAQARRSLARESRPGLLQAWVAALARAVCHRGTVTLALPASALAEGISALRDAGCGGIVVVPLWPRAGTAARLMLLQASRGSRAGSMIRSGLVLHEPDGQFTQPAQALLCGATVLVGEG